MAHTITTQATSTPKKHRENRLRGRDGKQKQARIAIIASAKARK